MTRTRSLILVTAPVSALLLVVALARASTAADPGPGQGSAPVRGNSSLAEARVESGLDLYYAGERIAGLSLSAVERRRDAAGYVSFLYGDCTAGDDLGCALPLEIQVWPACRRSLEQYDPGDPLAPRPERAQVRGVPALGLDEGRQLELQTGSSTVVIFGESGELVDRAAAALRGINNPARPGDPLRPPVPGALAGAVECRVAPARAHSDDEDGP